MVDVLPEPMSSADCDLRGLPWMPLDVGDVARSSLAAKASGDGFRAAVLLWCAAWQQVPAGSLPNDEQELAFLAGFGRDMRSWKRVRDWAMHKFVLCADGRLYHPIVCEKAMEALPGRQAAQDAKASTAERKRVERDDRKRMFTLLRERGHVMPYDTPTSRLRHLTSPEALPLLPAPAGDGDVTGAEPVTPKSVTGHGQVTAKTERGTETETEKDIVDDDAKRAVDWTMLRGLAEKLSAIAEAAGIPIDPSRRRWADELKHLEGWLAKGFDMEADIRPAIIRTLNGMPEGQTIGALKFIDRELLGARAKSLAKPAPIAKVEPKPLDFAKSGETAEMAAWRAGMASAMGAGTYRLHLDTARLDLDDELLTIIVDNAAIEATLNGSHVHHLERLTLRFLNRRLVRVSVAPQP